MAAACRQISLLKFNQHFKFYCKRLSSSLSANVSATEVTVDQEILVPYRIPRGPTDILETLATTIKKDRTAAQYKYEDDPYFIPISNVSKRSFALSKEAGKKAARYFLVNYPDLFVNKYSISQPSIKAYEPPVTYTDESEVSEEILRSCIESCKVENSLTIHRLLKENGISISEENELLLLQLLCFHNGNEPPDEDYYEERWFALVDRKPKNTWRQNGEAEKLFESMKKDNAEVYCTMIKGCSRFHHADRAMALYEEMTEKNLPATTATYNGLLSVVPFLKDDGDARWELAMNLVGNMNKEGLHPDLGTMNALFNTIARSKRWDKGKAMCIHLLAEMERLGIEPSLGTYFQMIVVFHFGSRAFSDALYQIMDRIDGKEHKIRHPDDVIFFVTAMEVCNKYLSDKKLGYRINNLLERGKNSHLIGGGFYESLYFQNFMKLLCQTEDFDQFMKMYETYVPHSYTPEPSVMKEILLSLEFHSAFKHLPKICSDIILFEQTEREDLLSELLKVAASVKHEEMEQQQLMTMIWGIVEKLDKRAEVAIRPSIDWTGQMMSDIMKTFLNGDDLEKAWKIMERLKEKEFSMFGLPEESVLHQFCARFMQEKEFEKVAFCVKFATEKEMPNVKAEAVKILEAMIEKKDLDENESMRAKILLLGHEAILEEDAQDNKESTV